MTHRHLLTIAFLLTACAGPATAAPLTLEDAIRLALDHNQRVKVSAFNPDIARAEVLAEYGRFDPALVFNRSYAEAETPGTITPPGLRPLTQSDRFGLALEGLTPWGLTYSLGASATNERGTFNAFASQYDTFGGLTITQPLLRGFGFGPNLAGLRIAKAGRGISDWQHRQTVIDTVTSVILAFNNLQQAHANVRIARLSRDLAARLYQDNEERRRVGAISDADVTQARARVANREESILIAERNVSDLENQLRLLIGDTAFSAGSLAVVELAPAADLSVDAADDTRRAYELRPDYQAARLGLAIDRANYAVAKNSLLPRLDFVGSYGHAGLDGNFRTSRQQVRDEEARAYSAGVVVRIPLTFAEGRGRARAARLALKRAETDLVRLEQEIAVSIAAAGGQIETTQQRVVATRQALELTRQALDAEEKRFKAGTSTTFFVLQQQELLAGVENSHARALADQRRALANYERETGTTLTRHGLTVE
jgi:outer membrane protein TolC